MSDQRFDTQQQILLQAIQAGFGVIQFPGGDNYTFKPDNNTGRNKPPPSTQGGGALDSVIVNARDYVAGLFPPRYVTQYDYNIGWNTRAHYKGFIGPNAKISFAALDLPAGIVVGLTTTPQSAGYEDIEHGFFLTHEVENIPHPAPWSERFAIVYRGEVGAVFDIPGASTNPKYTIWLKNGKIEYWVTLRTINVTTGEPEDGDSYKVAEVDADYKFWTLSTALYMGGDKITDLSVDQGSGGSLTIPAVGMFASDVSEYNTANIRFPAITSYGLDQASSTTSSITIPSVRAFAGDATALVAQMEIPAVSITAFSPESLEPLVDFTFGYVEMPSVMSQSICHDLTFGEADLSIPAVAMFASDVANVTVGRPTIPAVAVYAEDIEDPTRVFMREYAYPFHAISGVDTAFLLWTERHGLVGVVTATEIESALLLSQATQSDTWTAAEFLTALLSSTMSASDLSNLLDEQGDVWVLHMEPMGSTRYEGYNFNSYAVIDGVTYGANESGVYRLKGDTDDGTGINSSVDFGNLNFGTNELKSLPYVYVGMASTGETILKVTSTQTVNGRPTEQSYFYTVRDDTETMKMHRFEPGRGLRSTFYGVSLISEGHSFDLHNIEFVPVSIKRRL